MGSYGFGPVACKNAGLIAAYRAFSGMSAGYDSGSESVLSQGHKSTLDIYADAKYIMN